MTAEEYRETLRAQLDEGERLMTEAAEKLALIGVYTATPQQLREQNARYLAKLAAIARIGGEPADVVLQLIGGTLEDRKEDEDENLLQGGCCQRADHLRNVHAEDRR